MTFTELVAQDRVEWLTQRRAGIGASEAAAVAGRSPYNSPFNLHWRKRSDDVTVEDSNEYMSWGHRLEPVIRSHFAGRHPEFKVRDDVGLCVHDDRDWQRATPDGLLYEGPIVLNRAAHGGPYPDPVAGLEVKNANNRVGWDGDGWQGIPEHYYDQVQWSMDVTGMPVWWVAVLFGGNSYDEYEISYDAPYAVDLREQGQRFWDDLAAGNAPPIDAHDATTSRLRMLHPTVEDVEVEVPDDLAERYRVACGLVRDATTAKQQVENELRDAIGDARAAFTTNGRKVASRSVYEVTRIDTKQLKADAPHIADRYSVTSTINKLTPARRTA